MRNEEWVIETIRAYPEKGAAGRELSEAHFVANFGLEGDFHAVGGERQVSLFIAEIRDEIQSQKESGHEDSGPEIRGLCFSRFRENITIRGLDMDALAPGTRLEIGEAVLEITGETKRCHEECPLYETGKLCALAGRSLFAKVVKSGIVCVGDRVINNL